ncbi:hypothetical protein DXB25_21065 [Lachnospiraceae bacterium OM02-31]|nr:hypothetical protein DXB25_21065 [Lachnospiraceae bacterium OM02-31]RJW54617.1 hypothetical protein DXB24_25530 [Lachnospiraceae bacterium OM02-3]
MYENGGRNDGFCTKNRVNGYLNSDCWGWVGMVEFEHNQSDISGDAEYGIGEEEVGFGSCLCCGFGTGGKEKEEVGLC